MNFVTHDCAPYPTRACAIDDALDIDHIAGIGINHLGNAVLVVSVTVFIATGVDRAEILLVSALGLLGDHCGRNDEHGHQFTLFKPVGTVGIDSAENCCSIGVSIGASLGVVQPDDITLDGKGDFGRVGVIVKAIL